MKRALIIVFSLSLLIVLGCDSSGDKPFIASRKHSIIIKGPLKADTALIQYQDLDYTTFTDLKKITGLSDRDFSQLQLSEVKFTDIEGNKLSRFDYFNFYIVNENIGEVKVASTSNINDDFSETLVMENDVNYAEYFNKEGTRFKIETAYNEDIEEGNIQIQLEYKMRGIFKPKK